VETASLDIIIYKPNFYNPSRGVWADCTIRSRASSKSNEPSHLAETVRQAIELYRKAQQT